jgi:hypothetical protein
VSEDAAHELRRRCDLEDRDVLGCLGGVYLAKHLGDRSDDPLSKADGLKPSQVTQQPR